MSDEIKPALTTDEWAELCAKERPHPEGFSTSAVWLDNRETLWCEADSGGPALPRHQVAALALHGQPFGFTRDDVRALRSLVAFARMVPLNGASVDHIESIADRIAAMLPPAE